MGVLSLTLRIALALIAMVTPVAMQQEENCPETYLGTKFRDSNYVVTGLGTSKVTDNDKAKQGIKAFNFQFDVLCIYKGAEMPEKIEVIGVEQYNETMCSSFNLAVGEKRIVYLEHISGNMYRSMFSTDPINYLDELWYKCDMNMPAVYPIGRDKNNVADTCPEAPEDPLYDEAEDCVKEEIPTTVSPATAEKTTTKAPSKETRTESGDSGPQPITTATTSTSTTTTKPDPEDTYEIKSSAAVATVHLATVASLLLVLLL